MTFLNKLSSCGLSVRIITAVLLASGSFVPLHLTAQGADVFDVEVSIGAGFSYQSGFTGNMTNQVGGHGQLGVVRRLSERLALGAETALHGFVAQGCDADVRCSWGADRIGYTGATAVFNQQIGGLPLVGTVGLAGYYGGREGRATYLRPGGSIGLGVVVFQRETRALTIDVRYHGLVDGIADTRYLIPVTASLSW